MNQLMRPVDKAMNEERAEKIAIRKLWIEEIKTAAKKHSSNEVPLYLTLPGAEGKDIELLIKEGIIKTTEVNSISEDDLHKIVAIESSNTAIVALQKKFIGLNIQEMPFQNLIKGDELFSWPKGDQEKYCKAKIINLDLNAPLIASINDGQVKFAVPNWIDKLCRIHAKPPREDWTLCLTLNGAIVGPENVHRFTIDFLLDNINREREFGVSCREFWGEEMYNRITNNGDVNFDTLSRVEKQKLLMVMVPKLGSAEKLLQPL